MVRRGAPADDGGRGSPQTALLSRRPRRGNGKLPRHFSHSRCFIMRRNSKWDQNGLRRGSAI
jgi:hypothetical protein